MENKKNKSITCWSVTGFLSFGMLPGGSGLFFLLSGGVVSHFACGDSIVAALIVFMFMCLTVISWYLRPADRRLIPLNSKN